MGQKVNPHGFRIGVNKDWNSTWVASKKDISAFIKEDHEIRKHITDNFGMKAGLNNASVARITIERTQGRVAVNIYTGRAGMLIGQKGAGVEQLKKDLQKIVGAKALDLNIREVRNIDADADLVAQSIATQLEKRVAWRRAMKMAMQKAMKSGVKGVKVMVGGRLDGADIARSEHYQTGILPLHTLRSDIDYGFAEAKTTFGIIGVKCWICHGEIKGKSKRVGEVVRSTRERTDRKPFYGDKKPFGDRKPFDPNRPKRPFDQNRPGEERKPFDPNRPVGERRPFDPNRRPFDPNRPVGERKPFDPNRKPFDPNRPKPTGSGASGGKPTGPKPR